MRSLRYDPKNLLTSLVLVFPLFLVYQVGVLFTLPMLNGADFLTVFLFHNLGLSKGAYLAYDMEPHGTKFLVPLVATQDLTQTDSKSLLNLSLSLGYYTDPSHITTVSELLGVQVNLLRLTAVSTIPHFSGYIFASGREDSFDGGY